MMNITSTLRRAAGVLLGIGLLTALGGCGTVGSKLPGIDNFDQVSETLYRGGQPSPRGYRTLADRKVRTVINLRDGDDRREAEAVRSAGMKYVHLPLAAETVTAADAEKILQLMAESEGPVFVHCYVGRDRTGLAVAAYRMRVQGWTAEAALKDLYAHGHMWALYPQVKKAVVELGKHIGTEKAPIGEKPLTRVMGRSLMIAKQ